MNAVPGIEICLLWLILLLLSAPASANSDPAEGSEAADIQILNQMILVREKAMQEKDVETVMSQFSADSTWINSQGYYFEGRQSVLEFHGMLAETNPLDYTYEAGEARIRLLDASNAVVYYSWKMFWHEKGRPEDVVKDEIGLMTLIAQKREQRWYWIAVTNQHTPWFYDSIEPTFIEEE